MNKLLENIAVAFSDADLRLQIAIHFEGYTVEGTTITRREFFSRLKECVAAACHQALPNAGEQSLEIAISSTNNAVFQDVNQPTAGGMPTYIHLANASISGHGDVKVVAFWRGDIHLAQSFSLVEQPQPSQAKSLDAGGI
ncbi:MAG TPA: hypothetical protein VGB45_06110 [Abditibacterium sp.]